MSDDKKTWFVRFTYTKNDLAETETGLVTGENANLALNSVIQGLIERHGISRKDIDILAFNRV